MQMCILLYYWANKMMMIIKLMSASIKDFLILQRKFIAEGGVHE